MKRGRLEAFSDGVLAVAITIMVLEMKVPQGAGWGVLSELWPVFLSYVLSFVYIGIYWNNHHHLLSTCERVDGSIMWANLHLLFWLTLVPFVTGWMSETDFAPIPTTLYGAVLIMAGIAYLILQSRILAIQGPGSALRREIGWDWKGHVSWFLYLTGVVVALFAPMIAFGIYAGVAVLWLVPDRRVERALRQSDQHET